MGKNQLTNAEFCAEVDKGTIQTNNVVYEEKGCKTQKSHDVLFYVGIASAIMVFIVLCAMIYLSYFR